jgi:hypothetical protein
MWKYLFAIIICVGVKLNAAFELQSVGSEIIASGGITSTTLFGNNPAIMHNEHKIILTSNYTNLFGIKDLHCWDIGTLYNFNENNSLYFKSNSIGNEIYQENTYQIGFNHRFDIPISIGISCLFYDLSIVGMDNEQSVGVNLGICYYLNEKFYASSFYGNINSPKICDDKENLPQFYAAGLNWQIHEKVEVKAELFKDTIYPFNSRFGTKINLIKTIDFFTGIQTNPDRFSSGISIKLLNLKFISSLQTHQKLPETYYFGCQFFIK